MSDCVWCDKGNPSCQSSVSEAMVHTDTPVGRVMCKNGPMPKRQIQDTVTHFIETPISKSVDTWEQESEAVAKEARERANAYAKQTNPGVTKFQKRHPDFKGELKK